MKTIYSLLFTLLFVSSHSQATTPKNIIYMIGDGMGPSFTTAYRYYSDKKDTPEIEKTIFDKLLVGMAFTYPDDNTIVTDSAASATALSTGIKTYNGAIAVDSTHKPIHTILEKAKLYGYTTGLIATSQINHATPASFAAHNQSRKNYNQIADDYIDNKINSKLPVDLLLGGGKSYFLREDRNLITEFKENNYQYISSLNELDTLASLPAIGLFAEKGLPYAIDENPLRLLNMTKKALSLLEKQQNKFFVMIEGSQIDWCGHANDIACAMAEMNDFAKAVIEAKHYVDNNPETLLVITADHATGGLSLGANGQYRWESNVIKNITSSIRVLSEKLINVPDESVEGLWFDYTKIRISKSEISSLIHAKNQSIKTLYKKINEFVNSYSFTGWTTGGHTAVDVQVFAYGKGRQEFVGSQDNTDIAKKLINMIK